MRTTKVIKAINSSPEILESPFAPAFFDVLGLDEVVLFVGAVALVGVVDTLIEVVELVPSSVAVGGRLLPKMSHTVCLPVALPVIAPGVRAISVAVQ